MRLVDEDALTFTPECHTESYAMWQFYLGAFLTDTGEPDYWWRCSACKWEYIQSEPDWEDPPNYKYCPNCGSNMCDPNSETQEIRIGWV